MDVYIFKDGIFFGKNKLNLYEGLYLLKNKKIKVIDNNKKELSFDDIYSKLNDDLKLYYNVYEYLKEKNIRFGAGMKFGGPFRVYEDIEDEHSKWICIPCQKNSKFMIYDFIAKNRTAHSTRKTLLIAIENENKIDLLEIKWRRL